ncbi:MAG: phosphodiester glycosidase family protein [Pyrinomonadaceae bacterium]
MFCALCALCVAVSAQEWKTVKDGVEYAQVTKEIGGLNVNMNLLRLDLRKVRLDVVHAMDSAIGTETTSSIATRHRASAAINAGFFRLDNSIWVGDAAGILKVDGNLLSESNNDRVAIGIHNSLQRTDVAFGHPRSMIDVRDNHFTVIEVNGLNRERKVDEVIVYTPAFGRTTLTTPDGVEFIVRRGRVVRISWSGSSGIPPDGFVISGTGDAKTNLMERWKVGSLLKLNSSVAIRQFDFQPDIDAEKKRTGREFTFSSKQYFESEDMTNGVPQLIKAGKIDITWEQEKTTKSFVETRHPRTAVAQLKDGKFLMITVDGRSESSGGIGLQDLAEYLLSLGATDAMNLDGGGSTTMFLDGKVVNHPSDKEGERRVSDAILVTLRKPTRE